MKPRSPALIDRGFKVHLLYVWIRTPELAIRRVKARVRRGGHGVPDDVIRRRYARSAANLFRLYLPLAERAGTWRVYDNSGRELRLLASGGCDRVPTIVDTRMFARLKEITHGGKGKDGL